MVIQIILEIIKERDSISEVVELMDYKLHRRRLRRGGPYVKSPKWLANKKATINPKNKNAYECLRWSVISALNYNEILKKEFENIFKKIEHEDKDFSSHQRDWEILNKIMNELLLMLYFHHKIVKKKRLYINQDTI